MARKILGLDLGTTSIGFAQVVEAEKAESSHIEKIGVRIIQYDNFSKIDKSGKVTESKNPEQDFAAGRGLSPNAERTQKRGARRTLDRYQQRRQHLILTLKENGIITDKTILTEDGKNTTHSTFFQRAKAVVEKIELEALARVLLAINKKRGYKSSRKAKSEDGGQIIDGMAIAKRLYEERITPGQLAFELLKSGKKELPEFYRSDLQAEFDLVWRTQEQFYPEIFTPSFRIAIENKGGKHTSNAFWTTYKFNTAENKGKFLEKKFRSYEWRSESAIKQLPKEQVAYVLAEINNDINKSSGYLGAISDRSKELFFNSQTIGQYLYTLLQTNPHNSLKRKVFYRMDYLDEFEKIWETQSKYHSELTEKVKEEIRDNIIFYQRKLKSQKGLLSFCEFESRETQINVNGQNTIKRIGLKVTPKSSPLFQEFKIWQILNNLEFRNKVTKEIVVPDQEMKQLLFNELNIKGNLKATDVLKLIGYIPKDWEANYVVLEGNRTNKEIYDAYLRMLDLSGYDEDLFKQNDNDVIDISKIGAPANQIKSIIKEIFKSEKIDEKILEFDAELEGKAFEMQPSYKLWHLLYSYEGDESSSGNDKLCKLLVEKFGFSIAFAQILSTVSFNDDYGNLSAKAIRKIYPFIKEVSYDKACMQAGYRHSSASLTAEEIATRELMPKMDLLKKNSLRNPVVEKILNQMVNVVNSLIDSENRKLEERGLPPNFHFDEIRIELARELKKSADERTEMTTNINSAKSAHEAIVKLLKAEFAIANPTRKDIIRYKLYQELKNNGYKDLYTNNYIQREILFSKEIDIDHIIPQMKLFDDSFSNKTLVFRKDNQEKGNKTAFDYIEGKYGINYAQEFLSRAQLLFELGKKNKEEGISKAKFNKLKIKESEIGVGFIERDLRDSQYIAKKAKNMLLSITRNVVSTTGEITSKLREDWGLVNIMQELNLPKYREIGMTEMIEKKDGGKQEKIIDWTKRNDHRHHAMDALTIAFTKHNHIQFLNHLNARTNDGNKFHKNIIAIEAKETEVITDEFGSKKRRFKAPITNFRETAKMHLERVLVSFKAKNKVVTKNKNKIKLKTGEKVKIELTPRGQLHKETVYGKYRYYESKYANISVKFDEETISKVANPLYRELLLGRLQENAFDSKKAFGGKNAISKAPIYLDVEKKEKLPESVLLKWLVEDYSIRKEVTPDNFSDLKAIEKVIDDEVRKRLIYRLNEFKGDPKSAFSDLDKNPIWLNRDKGIVIKKVKISGVKNAEFLHYKKDHFGNLILNESGNPIPTDFVSTGNNHHVAIYRDKEGNLQERVISLFDAVKLAKSGLPIVDKLYNHNIGWKFMFSMKQNEYFVFPGKDGFDPNNIDLLDESNRKAISPNLFRVQKIASKNYFFRHHLESTLDDRKELKDLAYKPQLGLNAISNIVKVKVNHIGLITMIGEY